MGKIIKILIITAGVVLLAAILFISWLTITEYKPDLKETITINNPVKSKAGTTLSIFNWNIGYGALGRDVDFFFDGGETVITSEKFYHSYINGISEVISMENSDIFFLQEVDINSKRSYGENQYERFSDLLNEYSGLFAYNYKVAYIPPPALFKNSYGKVEAGLGLFSKYEIDSAERLTLPGNYSWPKSTMFLDRCMLTAELTTVDGKEVVLINTHNSAYDQGGFIKKDQLAFIKEYATDLYEKGKYVIIGGDWNSFMPGIDRNTYDSIEEGGIYYQEFPDNWTIENWKWGFDDKVPSSRSLNSVYIEGENFVTLIDGFIVSPNINIKNVETVDMGFRFSDHNPVKLTVELD